MYYYNFLLHFYLNSKIYHPFHVLPERFKKIISIPFLNLNLFINYSSPLSHQDINQQDVDSNSPLSVIDVDCIHPSSTSR